VVIINRNIEAKMKIFLNLVMILINPIIIVIKMAKKRLIVKIMKMMIGIWIKGKTNMAVIIIGKTITTDWTIIIIMNVIKMIMENLTLKVMTPYAIMRIWATAIEDLTMNKIKTMIADLTTNKINGNKILIAQKIITQMIWETRTKHQSAK
jgi:hypothetical protein